MPISRTINLAADEWAQTERICNKWCCVLQKLAWYSSEVGVPSSHKCVFQEVPKICNNWHRTLIYIKTRYVFLTRASNPHSQPPILTMTLPVPRGLDLIHRFHCVGSTLPIPWWRETVCEKVFYQYRYRCIPQKPKKEKYLFGIWRILNPDPMLNRPLPVLIVFLFLCERLGGAFAYHPSEYQTSPNVISHLGSKCTPLWFQWSEKTNWTMTLLHMVQICSWELI